MWAKIKAVPLKDWELLEKKLVRDIRLLKDLHEIEGRLQDQIIEDLRPYNCKGCLNQHRCWNSEFSVATIVDGHCLNRK